MTEAKKLNLPILVLQGERDYQVTIKDFGFWQSALEPQKSATLRSFPKGKATPQEYQKGDHVAQEVVGIVATWVKEH